MKKKLVLMLVLIVALGSAVAFAVAGARDDALVSLAYLNGTYRSNLITEAGKTINAAQGESHQAAQNRLNQEAEKVRKRLQNADTGAAVSYGQFTPSVSGYADQISLSAGSGFLFLEGKADATTQGGELIDVTDGTAGNTVTLQEGRRYLVGEGATATVTIRSEAALLAPMGQVSHQDSDQTALPFTDVARNDWYYSAVQYVYEEQLLQGVTERQFAPGETVTRGMLATILHRLAKEPAVTGSVPEFSDVSDQDWYAKGVSWVASVEVTKGLGDGRFAPKDTLTREQLATMLYRYATKYAKVNEAELGDLQGFVDQESVSPWAMEAMCWAVGVGILQGDQNALKPVATASRAESATMLQRFAKHLGGS